MMPYRVIKRHCYPYLLLLPVIAALLAIIVYPLCNQVNISLHQLVGFAGKKEFVGLKNYQELLQHPDFLKVVKNTLYFVGVTFGLQFMLGLGAALLLNQDIKGRNVFATLLLLPWIISYVVAAAIWQWLLDPLFGAVNSILISLGILNRGRSWLGEPNLALTVISIVKAWKAFPLMMVLLFAGLKTIPRGVYEAGKIDGVNVWQEFMYITLPLIMPQIVAASLLAILGLFNSFALIYLTTGGGPAKETLIIPVQIYRLGIDQLNFESSTALATMMAIGLLVFIGFYVWTVKRFRVT